MPEGKKTSRGSRDKNYTDRECLELIRAVKKYVHIIEYKNQGQPGSYKYRNEDRSAAWEAICREFNMRTSQNRTVAGLRVKWMCDKSNIRDYVQYILTSQSRSGRPPEEIPKPRFMPLIAEMIGSYCPELGPIPNIDEISLELPECVPDTSVRPIKEEPTIENAELPFEEIMFNENDDQFNYTVEDTSSMDSFSASTSQNHSLQPPPAKRTKHSSTVPPSFQSNGIPTTSNGVQSTSKSADILQDLQVQLLKRQIEFQEKQIKVQELLAKELEVKIEREQQQIKIDAAESELRCKEISKRLES